MIKIIKDARVSMRLCGDIKKKILKKHKTMQSYFDFCIERDFTKKKVKK